MAEEVTPPEEEVTPPEMLREYFIGTEAECNAFVSKMDFMLGYPNVEVKTNTYSLPREHAAKTGTWYMLLKAVFGSKINGTSSLEMLDDEMSPTELGKKMTLLELTTEEAFPKNEI